MNGVSRNIKTRAQSRSLRWRLEDRAHLASPRRSGVGERSGQSATDMAWSQMEQFRELIRKLYKPYKLRMWVKAPALEVRDAERTKLRLGRAAAHFAVGKHLIA